MRQYHAEQVSRARAFWEDALSAALQHVSDARKCEEGQAKTCLSEPSHKNAPGVGATDVNSGGRVTDVDAGDEMRLVREFRRFGLERHRIEICEALGIEEFSDLELLDVEDLER